MKRKALGKGLSSLIPDAPPKAVPKRKSEPRGDAVLQIDLDRIRPNRAQPREDFDPEALADLAKSMTDAGVIQPVVVRRTGPDAYELIAGERRWRAAQLAGLLRVPAVVRDVPDDQLLEVALIENLQREELNPIEEARAYQALMDSLDLSQQEVADRVGRRRATVSNMLRLLSLPKAVQLMVRAGEISMGHARALVSVPGTKQQTALAEQTRKQGLSVRQVESMVQRLLKATPAVAPKPAPRRDPNVEAAEESLQKVLGTRVRIVQGRKGAGRLEFHFYSDEELQRLYQIVYEAARRESK